MSRITSANFAFPLVLLILLLGCSREVSLEDKIVDLLEESENRDYQTVIDYDIKGDFIVVIYTSKSDEQLNIGFIKNNKGKLEWEIGMGGPKLTGGYIYISDPLIVNVMIPEDPEINHVKVFGEYAKQIKHSKVINYWISYSNKSPSSFDVEYIK
ncbi:hypothetical protein FZC74_14065 [Sutcliffiella horikoshii]|uniref:Lipoprotein n=1 Tax=Sutcliffiella horikoshii TaxID=79883 RepID=A0AA94WPS3_9BACI|nr:hypothetical protein [Sutcliffiella horikoshii]TYS58113.1 hypothetical protein FZC74_14065 [Sutcliffiella horikoshii]